MGVLNLSNRTVISTQPSATVQETVEKMAELGISAILVMEAVKLCGIFTERDLLRRVVAKRLNPKEVLMRDVMSTPARTVQVSASPEEALRMMRDFQIRHLPVVDPGLGVLGILSLLQLLDHRIDQLNSETESIAAFVMADGPGGD